MKKALSTLIFCSIVFSISAQEWTKEIKKANPDFYDIQKAFNEYYKTHIPSWEADDDYGAKSLSEWKIHE